MRCNLSYSKEDLLQTLYGSAAELQQMLDTVLKELCNCKPFVQTVHSFVKTRGGSTEDAEDLIQEGLSQFVISFLDGKYKGDSSIENFAFGICKYKWLNKWSKKGIATTTMMEEDKDIQLADDMEDDYMTEELKELLWEIIDSISGHCPDYLKLWAFGYKHEEIAEQLNVSEKRARKNTSSCRQKLRDYLAAHPRLQALLQELNF